MNTEIHLTPMQVAERLHVKVGTLAAWRVRGTGPSYIKAGKKVLYPTSSLISWEQENLQTSTAQN